MDKTIEELTGGQKEPSVLDELGNKEAFESVSKFAGEIMKSGREIRNLVDQIENLSAVEFCTQLNRQLVNIRGHAARESEVVGGIMAVANMNHMVAQNMLEQKMKESQTIATPSGSDGGLILPASVKR